MNVGFFNLRGYIDDGCRGQEHLDGTLVCDVRAGDSQLFGIDASPMPG